jgi:hypothetical protein
VCIEMESSKGMLCAVLCCVQGIKLYWHVLETMLTAEEARAGLPAAGMYYNCLFSTFTSPITQYPMQRAHAWMASACIAVSHCGVGQHTLSTMARGRPTIRCVFM